MSAVDKIAARRLAESMRDVVQSLEKCEADLRYEELVPTSVWVTLDHAASIAREALSEAELELYRPAKPRRRDVEELAVQCDRLLSKGEVRP